MYIPKKYSQEIFNKTGIDYEIKFEHSELPVNWGVIDNPFIFLGLYLSSDKILCQAEFLVDKFFEERRALHKDFGLDRSNKNTSLSVRCRRKPGSVSIEIWWQMTTHYGKGDKKIAHSQYLKKGSGDSYSEQSIMNMPLDDWEKCLFIKFEKEFETLRHTSKYLAKSKSQLNTLESYIDKSVGDSFCNNQIAEDYQNYRWVNYKYNEMKENSFSE